MLDRTRQYNRAGQQPLQPSEVIAYIREIHPIRKERKGLLKKMLAMDSVAMANYQEAYTRNTK